ncbi:MAG TPA: pyrimidine 5'-nucleotidase [Hyphomicrobiaceae bacterium]|nr:pyrimidine 5'-nucleotidase [Hyphomicrobiaceae bacterium]
MTQRGSSSGTGASPRRGFDRTETWIFDLDNTLYPAECNLFAEVDRRMAEYIQRFLGVPYDYAKHLQKAYYRQFGTTLAGMMQVHNMDPTDFLHYVHEIDLTPVPASPALRAAIERLPGRKLIFTAGSHRHAERVAGKLGILDLFEDIIDIVDSGFLPKEKAESYGRLIASHGIEPGACAMFEDMPHNLEPAHLLGMTTVLVHSSKVDHPVQQRIRSWTSVPDHIHHMTEDLAEFLAGIVPAAAQELQP